jgi:hypothetical protein
MKLVHDLVGLVDVFALDMPPVTRFAAPFERRLLRREILVTEVLTHARPMSRVRPGLAERAAYAWLKRTTRECSSGSRSWK